jgi:hypothetical protein
MLVAFLWYRRLYRYCLSDSKYLRRIKLVIQLQRENLRDVKKANGK